jgi:hypothetical protein
MSSIVAAVVLPPMHALTGHAVLLEGKGHHVCESIIIGIKTQCISSQNLNPHDCPASTLLKVVNALMITRSHSTRIPVAGLHELFQRTTLRVSVLAGMQAWTTFTILRDRLQMHRPPQATHFPPQKLIS